ncbi:MAG: 4a-hydroxytetrahydrobiopterin dehydratase [Planctomycetota bacterium]
MPDATNPLADRSLDASPAVLDAAAADEFLQQLPAGWSIDAGSKTLAKTFEFAEFDATMTFVNAVADVAREANHHPDMELGYAKARIAWTSHDAGGLTVNDFVCAARTDRASSS